jgi:hypothetical protein
MPHEDCLNIRLGDYFERRRNQREAEKSETEEPGGSADVEEGGVGHKGFDEDLAP